MVEGHQVHRVAILHRQRLLNSKFKATSPNGKFSAGAKAVNGRKLARVEAIGKNLFYFFGDEAEESHEQAVVHVHFGMSGQFRLHRPPGPEPTANTRLALKNRDVVAYLSAMTCQLGTPSLFQKKMAELGPDPLREDADAERFWAKLQKTSKGVGQMLMDQAVIAGIGNIYRAEILFRAGVHPEQPSNTITREQFVKLWNESALLLQRGVKTGSILTVDPAENLPEPWKRRYIYNHTICPRCKGTIRTWDIATRKAYACENCQPLVGGLEQLPAARIKALGQSKQHEQFVSHCAPEPKRTKSLPELRKALKAAGLSTIGRKADLLARLEGLSSESGDQEEKTEVNKEPVTEAVADGAEKAKSEDSAESIDPATVLANLSVAELRLKLKDRKLKTTGKKVELVQRLAEFEEGLLKTKATAEQSEESGRQQAKGVTQSTTEVLVKPGTSHLGAIRGVRQAEEDKQRAGESAAVEHVGIVDRTDAGDELQLSADEDLNKPEKDTEREDRKQRKLPFRNAKRRRTTK